VGRFLKQYEILFKKAVVDLNSAKVIWISFEQGNIELDMEVIFFHLQQCSEKFIKSLLDFYQIKFPRTHDLQSLINLLETHNIELNGVEKLLPLSVYAVEGRYAILHDDLDDVDRYIEIVDELLEIVRIQINEIEN
jgi:HEPN domain-containing protein